MGAITALLAIMVKHQHVTVRHLACSIFVKSMLEGEEIQLFAYKAGALNLAIQFDRENIVMKHDILRSLSFFICNENFVAKREFLFFHDGAATLGRWIKDDMEFVNADKKSKI